MQNRLKPACYLIIVLFLLITKQSASAQTDSSRLQISLLTCSPGEELYSSWGHTAIRVVDSAAGTDNVFNYGTFDDSDPLFLPRFTKGLMIYSLSFYPYREFLQEYQYFNRGVIEQVLNLGPISKQNLYKALLKNYEGNNRFYEYYFHTDNCTTRARDMIARYANDSIRFGSVVGLPAPSFRKLIHQYLDTSGQQWNKLGIDILLGSHLDEKASDWSATFLPDYLLLSFDKATIGSLPLVKEKKTVLTAPVLERGSFLGSPLFIFSLLALVVLWLSFSASSSAQRTLNIFDTVFFLLLGIVGCLLAVLWIIRIDTVCRNNYNLLWLVPTHLPFAFFMLKNKNWIRKYLLFTLVLAGLTLLVLLFRLQQLNTAVIPFLVIIISRSWKRLQQA